MASWVKKNCYVVHAYYRDELYQNNEAPMKEEEVFSQRAKRSSAKKSMKPIPILKVSISRKR